jgi:Protein of unknown function (DUF1653)
LALSLYEVKKDCIFKNKKTKDIYKVIAVGIHTENYDVLVTYEDANGGIHHRPLGLFCYKFEEVNS